MFVFSAKDGMCPSCCAFGRKWYIQDRAVGDGRYDYCLMSFPTDPQPVYRFKNLAETAAWLNNTQRLEQNAWWVGAMIRRWTVADCDEAALIEKDGVQYRLDKRTFTLSALPKCRQETGWFSSYLECLAWAKKILNEKRETGRLDA